MNKNAQINKNAQKHDNKLKSRKKNNKNNMHLQNFDFCNMSDDGLLNNENNMKTYVKYLCDVYNNTNHILHNAHYMLSLGYDYKFQVICLTYYLINYDHRLYAINEYLIKTLSMSECNKLIYFIGNILEKLNDNNDVFMLNNLRYYIQTIYNNNNYYNSGCYFYK